MKKFVLVLTFLSLQAFSQELPTYPRVLDDTDIGISFSLRDNGKGQGQSLISTFFVEGNSDYNAYRGNDIENAYYHSFYVASSVDNITFDERENSITFGVKGSYFLSPSEVKDIGVSVGVDADVNSNIVDITARVLRSAKMGRNFFFDHGLSLGGFSSNHLNLGLDRNGGTFSAGPELGLRTTFKIGENSSLDLSARALYHMMPMSMGKDIDGNDRKGVNGARLQTKSQVAYRNNRITVFLSNRSELIKAKDYFENGSMVSGGVRIPIRSNNQK
ncbi:MAG: hypothetical protein H6621_10180 [Halobacteriovoraceae bacterium]|nr:hypothetical protein [Halobacteriovoraceae bacterium]MCB9095424.1 hypothetical protein [Halobacteriovoraceae bacterium]